MKELDNFQEIKTICIECVSPVNIADGVKLNPKEYLFDRKNGMVYFLNQLSWHKFIYSKKLLSSYEKYMTDFREKRSLFEWLSDSGYGIEDVKFAIKSSTTVVLNQLYFQEKKTLNEIITQERLSTGEIYLPGSSIKGVIRTAILYALLQKNPRVKEKYWRDVYKVTNDRYLKPNQVKAELGKIAKNLEAELLHKLNLLDEQGRGLKGNNAVCSVMRGISCSDANAANDIATAVLQKVDCTYDKKTGKPKESRLPIFRECVLPNNKFYCSLKIEKSITSVIGINSIDDLLEMLEGFFAFTKNIFGNAFARDFSNAFHNISEANAYIGSNTGFLTKTVIAALAPSEREAVAAIKSWLNVAFRDHNHIIMDKHISPRTLKTTYYNGKQYIMGLVKVYKNE
ncbi:MAG: type III-A CRISPR-associated RAMP protein Csm5 [Phascolarctobacterium sp.]|nr:type III-A CRISPR-associated RAMP protein Csm5 [Phascolarctobacterium sp.]